MEWSLMLHRAPKRVNHAAVVVDDCIYSFGGYVSNHDFSDRTIPIEIFVLNTRTYKWQTLIVDSKNAPYRRYGHTVVAHGRNVYLWGGRNDEYCDGILYCFDTVSRSWSQPKVSGIVPLASDGHAACIHKDTMYIHGGYIEQISQFTLSLHALNLCTLVWTEMPLKGQYPLFRDFHTMCCDGDGNLLVYGGREMPNSVYGGPDKETYPNNLHIYMVEKQLWRAVSYANTDHTPSGRRSHSSFFYKDKLFVFAGFNSQTAMHMNDIFSFDMRTSSWVCHSHPDVRPSPRRRQAMCRMGSLVYMFGGTHPDTSNPNNTDSEPYDSEDEEKESLEELEDLWILDLEPRLETLALLKVVRSHLPLTGLPVLLQKRAYTVPIKDHRYSPYQSCGSRRS
ncbi:kelch domain-containing protein 3 [Hyalella azteca]|uniref:Kelch domain-containing protein 3 n=1 Tax=Hyalella azteca TaxID=294128 RepID=A0A8B7PD23_HYAAZ|nr:kelch domain-containing protein 3 [Hyalella azteca]